MELSGPFFVKENNEYILADICKNCAFGDEEGCLLDPCIYLEFIEEDEKDD